MDAFGGERKIMAYNKHGDVGEEQSTRDSQQVAVDDEGHVVEASKFPSNRAHNFEARYS